MPVVWTIHKCRSQNKNLPVSHWTHVHWTARSKAVSITENFPHYHHGRDQYLAERSVELQCGEGILVTFLLICETAAKPHFLEIVHQKTVRLYHTFPVSCPYVSENFHSLKSSSWVTWMWTSRLMFQQGAYVAIVVGHPKRCAGQMGQGGGKCLVQPKEPICNELQRKRHCYKCYAHLAYSFSICMFLLFMHVHILRAMETAL